MADIALVEALKVVVDQARLGTTNGPLIAACKAFLDDCGYAVVDPSKCMVLGMVEGVPEDDEEKYLVIIGGNHRMWVDRTEQIGLSIELAQKAGHSISVFGPISLPTEAR